MGFSTGPFTFAHNNILGFGFLESLTSEACENDLRFWGTRCDGWRFGHIQDDSICCKQFANGWGSFILMMHNKIMAAISRNQ